MHVMAAGDLLIAAKSQLKHGQWLPWLAEHCAMPERTAQLYMRMAKNRTAIEKQIRNVPDLTFRGAVAALAPPNEGEAILQRIAAADAEIADAVADKLERQRVFAEWLYELSPADREAVLAAIGPEVRKLWRRWRKPDVFNTTSRVFAIGVP
jgi:Protein of unknown function (DUF3102)